MPKFLDVPSYYGESGRELSLDLGYSTLSLQSASNIQFHQNLCPYGRYRLSFIANNASANVFLYLYSGGSTVNAYNIGGAIYAAKEEFDNIYFEWGEGLGNYGLDSSVSALAVKFHATFYNMAPSSPSYFPSSGTSYRYYPGKITTIVWGATTAGGSFSEGEMHIYVSDQLTLNGKAWNTSTRALSFYAPENGGTGGQILQSNGTSAPTWISGVAKSSRMTGLSSGSISSVIPTNATAGIGFVYIHPANSTQNITISGTSVGHFAIILRNTGYTIMIYFSGSSARFESIGNADSISAGNYTFCYNSFWSM